MPKYNFFMSRQNATFWSKVGETGVGKMEVGEQGPICEYIFLAKVFKFT